MTRICLTIPTLVQDLLLGVAIVAVCLITASPAQAQTLTLPGVPATLVRQSPNGTLLNKRAQQNFPDGISGNDCREDLQIEIPYALSAIDPSMSLQVWASASGQDCTQQTSRVGPSRVCWLISQSNIPLVLAGSMRLKVRDIIAQSKSIDAGEAYVNAGADVCGTVDRQSFSIFVMLLRGPDVLAGERLPFEADTIGPPPLSSVKVTPRDSSMAVSWATNGAAEANGAQVSIFYGPGTVQTDVSSARKCNAEGFTVERDGSVTVDERKLSRLYTGGGGSNALISELTNGATYAVAIGATDAFLNLGMCPLPSA
jgi:hypothetical protein